MDDKPTAPRAKPTAASLREISHLYGPVEPEAVVACLSLLRRAADVQARFERAFAPHGLSHGRFMILMLLRWTTDELTAARLAEMAGVSRPTITGLLDALERDGLIRRTPKEGDARARIVRLAPSGNTFLDRILPEHFSIVSNVMKRLDKAELQALIELLEKVDGAPQPGVRESPTQRSGATRSDAGRRTRKRS